MKVFIIGGTGLLGSESASELLRRGHQVKSIALSSSTDLETVPKEMEIIFGNYMGMSDGELQTQMKECDALVFAAGVDERVEFPKPVMHYYEKYNIDALCRLLAIGRDCGIKKAVVMGSYFAYFAKKWPHLQLTEKHPYIRSRILQEEAALSFNTKNFEVMVLELPYIFGTQPGRKPVWTFMVSAIQGMKGATFFPKGGTTMVTVHQVAQAVAGALEQGKGGTCYPVGWYNMTWKQLINIFHKNMGLKGRKIFTIPTFLYKMSGRKIMKDFARKGVDSGLDMVAFAELQTAETFIDKKIIENELGVEPDNIEKAIGDSVKLCMDVLKGNEECEEMKAE